MADLKLKGPWFRLVRATFGWASCIIDIFNPLNSTRAWTHIWIYVQLGSPGPYCTQWADDQHRSAGLEPRLVLNLSLPQTPTIIDPRVIDFVSSPVWWKAETNITFWPSAGVSMLNGRLEAEKPRLRLGKLHY